MEIKAFDTTEKNTSCEKLRSCMGDDEYLQFPRYSYRFIFISIYSRFINRKIDIIIFPNSFSPISLPQLKGL